MRLLYLPKAGRVAIDAHHAPRPNRLAAGMTASWERTARALEFASHEALKRRRLDPSLAVARLRVRGTCDSLGAWTRAYPPFVALAPCPCCGGPTKRLVLSPVGRVRLQAARRRYKARLMALMLGDAP